MKIRTDFVTNSSSSSYCFAYIKSGKVADLLRKYEAELADCFWKVEKPGKKEFKKLVDYAATDSGLYISDDGVLYCEQDSIGSFHTPASLYGWNGVINSVVEGMRDESRERRYDGIEGADLLERIALEFEESNYELTDSIKECRFECGHGAWQGDFSYDYSRDGLKEELLAKVIPEIVEEYDYDGPDEVTDEDITHYVKRYGLFFSDYYDYSRKSGEEINGSTESVGETEVEDVTTGQAVTPKNRKEIFDYPDEIECNGKAFVTTCLSLDDEQMIRSDVSSRGGAVRGAVSGKTNYLIAFDEIISSNKLSNAIEQKQKGKDIQIITLAHYLEVKRNGKLKNTETSAIFQNKEAGRKKKTDPIEQNKAEDVQINKNADPAIEEMLNYLRQRYVYGEDRAFSLEEIEKDNPNLSLHALKNWAIKEKGQKLATLLKNEGIITDNVY